MNKEKDTEQAGDFDWNDLEPKGFGESYTPEEKKKLTDLYDETVTSIEENKVVTSKVVAISKKDVVLNINFKSDGLVPLNEFRDMPDLKIGDEVDVYVEAQEDINGQLLLSKRKAKIVKSWEQIQFSFDNDKVIEGTIKRRTKGGLIVDIFGIEAFLPGSQIDVKPIRDFDQYVGKNIELKVVKVNYSNDNVVVSHKILIEKDIEKQKIEILKNLERGQVLEGVIKNMTSFGVFIDLGGVDGLLHITDISWGRISRPEEFLELDQKVKIVVLDFDDNKKRISLGMKQLTPHPWDFLEESISVGTKVSGKIVNVADYGAFLEIKPGVEGLIHVSEMSWSQHLRNPQEFLQTGSILEAVILTIDKEDRKMSLGIKQLTEDPWTKESIRIKYSEGTIHTGIIRNLTPFGLFLELEEGIDGLVHISDLSWTKKIKHPSEFVKISDELAVKVLELDTSQRRLALSHKHLEENPWEAFKETFAVGTVHKCTVVDRNEKGVVLELPYGLEGFALSKYLKKEDDSAIEIGEILDFSIINFSKEERKITLSHTHSYKKKKIVEVEKKRKTPEPLQRSTFSDIDVLSQLKENLKGETPSET